MGTNDCETQNAPVNVKQRINGAFLLNFVNTYNRIAPAAVLDKDTNPKLMYLLPSNETEFINKEYALNKDVNQTQMHSTNLMNNFFEENVT